jgi:hypothetical protein
MALCDARKAAGDGRVAGNKTALLIIRVWIEEGSSEPLRAHVRMTESVSEGFRRALTLSRAEAVCAEVERWLASILNQHPSAAEVARSDDARTGPC